MKEMIPAIVVLCVMAIPFILRLVDAIFKTNHSCKYFGWHDGKGSAHSFDGCSVHATCSKCGKEVMQDSQGNWF